MRAKFLGYSLIALFTVWAVCAALGVLGLRKLFYEEGGGEYVLLRDAVSAAGSCDRFV